MPIVRANQRTTTQASQNAIARMMSVIATSINWSYTHYNTYARYVKCEIAKNNFSTLIFPGRLYIDIKTNWFLWKHKIKIDFYD